MDVSGSDWPHNMTNSGIFSGHILVRNILASLQYRQEARESTQKLFYQNNNKQNGWRRRSSSRHPKSLISRQNKRLIFWHWWGNLILRIELGNLDRKDIGKPWTVDTYFCMVWVWMGLLLCSQSQQNKRIHFSHTTHSHSSLIFHIHSHSSSL